MKPVINPHSKVLASGLAVFSAMALTAFGQQLPEPLLYYSFDVEDGVNVENAGTLGTAGMISGGATYGESKDATFGQAFYGNRTGDNDALIQTGFTGDDLGFGAAGVYTAMAWINWSGSSGNGDHMVFGQDDGAGNNAQLHHGIRDDSAPLNIHFGGWGGDQDISDAGAVPVDTWTHVAWQYDGADKVVYVDGVETSRVAGNNITNPAFNLIIGGHGRDSNLDPAPGNSFNGAIDEVKIYDEALTAQQILEALNPAPDTGEDNENGGAGDGMDDGWELANGLDPAVDDSAGNPDNDGLTNLEEWNGGDNSTDPMDADSDNDDLNDGDEVNTHNTDPNDADSDDDGLNDGAEIAANTLPLDADTDDDGMGDGYEVDNGHDPLLAADAAQDADDDGSLNLEECERGTDPNEQDTDMDGLFDGVENGGGTFVNEMMTGTDPLNPDTDNDGLADGVEDGGGTFISATQTGTDPNKIDTDGDIQTDGFEVTNSTDPNDPESKSAVATVTVIAAPLGGDLTDPEDDGVEGDTIPADGETPQTAGTNFNWVSITASSEEYFGNFGGSEGFFDVFDNLIGGGQNKVCCNGAPQDITVGFAVPVSLTHFTLTSSNDTPARDPLDFQIQGSNDGVTFEVIYDRADDASLWDSRNQTVRIDLPAISDAYTFIRYAVTRTGGANHAMAEIEYFGEEGSLAPPEITSIDYDNETSQVTLTWSSRENKTYSVFTSVDLTDFSEDIDDSVESDGEITSYTFTLFGNDPRRFFRVELNE